MPPPPSSWQPAWDEVAVVSAMAAVYFFAARLYPVSRLRAAAFAASLVLILAASVTPLATLALNYLLSAHLVQNVVMAEWAPALAVAGLPPALTAALAPLAPLRLLTRPVVALPLWLLTYAFWHVPAVYDAALQHHLLLHTEHGTYFLAGSLLWWPVLHARPWQLSAGGKAAYLFAAFVFASPLGLLLALLPDAIYDFYVEAPRIWGLSPLADQQIGGVIMAVSEAVVFFGVFAWFFVRFMAEEDAGYSPGDA